MSNVKHVERRSPRRCGFTLAELLVVMAIIAILATITVVAVGAIANDARLSSAKNTVMTALENARALALKKNTYVLVAFTPRFEDPGRTEQVVEVVTAEWTGEAFPAEVLYGTPSLEVVERYVPIPDVAVRRLPRGIKVAGPSYNTSGSTNYDDLAWVTQSHLPAIDQLTGQGETPGSIIGVLYGPRGNTLTDNPQSDAARQFIDFDTSGTQSLRVDLPNPIEIDYRLRPQISVPDFNGNYFDHFFEKEERFVTMVPFLTVFDDEEAREIRAEDWTSTRGYEELVGSPGLNGDYFNGGYISERADTIYFNRFTGVAMR